MMELDCVRHSGIPFWDRTAGMLRFIDFRQHLFFFFSFWLTGNIVNSGGGRSFLIVIGLLGGI